MKLPIQPLKTQMPSLLKLISVSIRQPLVKHWNKFPREVLESPSLDRFQTWKEGPKQPDLVDFALSTFEGPFQPELLYNSIDFRNSIQSERICTIFFGTQNRRLLVTLQNLIKTYMHYLQTTVTTTKVVLWV